MKKNKILICVGIALFIAIIMVTLFFYRSINVQEFEQYNFYQYFFGEKVVYTGVMKITKNDNNTQMSLENDVVELDSKPVYYSDIKNQVLLPEDMEIVYPVSGGLIYKVNHFTNIIQKEESIYLKTQISKKNIQNAFLYDGEDTYVFVEKTTITLDDGTKIEVSPLSYAQVRYNESIEIYNYEKDECTYIESPSKNVIAQTDNYSINISTDSIKYGDKQQLLIKNQNELKNLDMDQIDISK